MPKIHFAPVQGHTDAAYRHFHSKIYGQGDCTYYTPFIRYEKDGIRQRDIKDLSSPLNNGLHLIPQIIFRDKDELQALVKFAHNSGFSEINLNMGCPFPLQTGHGRGAATIANKALAEDIENIIRENPDIVFSIKMRLGMSDPYEWKNLLPHLNNIPLCNIALHPRVAKQQYGGELNLEVFYELVKHSKHPVIFNGELKKPEDIHNVLTRFPEIKEVMIGRGLLARPSIIEEFMGGEEWDKAKRLETMLSFHRHLLNYYSENLCGESQIISKIKPFWEYAEDEIGRKAWKAIKKANNIAKYHSAVASI